MTKPRTFSGLDASRFFLPLLAPLTLHIRVSLKKQHGDTATEAIGVLATLSGQQRPSNGVPATGLTGDQRPPIGVPATGPPLKAARSKALRLLKPFLNNL